MPIVGEASAEQTQPPPSFLGCSSCFREEELPGEGGREHVSSTAFCRSNEDHPPSIWGMGLNKFWEVGFCVLSAHHV